METRSIHIASTGTDDLDVILLIREALKLLPISKRRIVIDYLREYPEGSKNGPDGGWEGDEGKGGDY
jgi:hypothetical protein